MELIKRILENRSIDESSETALKNKAEKSGVSLSTLRTVYRRGVAAWNSGHRPGTTPQQWGMARVNSYITKGKTYHTADKDLREGGERLSFGLNDISEECWAEDSRLENDAYHKGVSSKTAKARVAHWKKMDKLSDKDPRSYEPAPGDATAKTKLSKHTLKFRQMYGEETEILYTEDLDEQMRELDEMPGANMDTRAVHQHLKKAGWSLSRTSGGHDIYTHPEAKHSIPVPRHRQLKAPLVLGILKSSKLRKEESKLESTDMLDESEVPVSKINKIIANTQSAEHGVREVMRVLKVSEAEARKHVNRAIDDAMKEEVELDEEDHPKLIGYKPVDKKTWDAHHSKMSDKQKSEYSTDMHNGYSHIELGKLYKISKSGKAWHYIKEEFELSEEKHRVSVTVSEPDHLMVSKRKETQQKFVRLTADSNESAVEKAKAHYKKKGFKVHDAEHVGMVKEEVESVDESEAYQKDMDKNKPVFAQGVKGMKSTPFVKKFKSQEHYERWADSDAAGDHEVHRLYQEEVEFEELAESSGMDEKFAKAKGDDKPFATSNVDGTTVRHYKSDDGYIGHAWETKNGQMQYHEHPYKGEAHAKKEVKKQVEFHNEPAQLKSQLKSKAYDLLRKDRKMSEEAEQIEELSNPTLASYKKKAGEDISKANASGNVKKADKRFSGIVKATNKQFDNDAKARLAKLKEALKGKQHKLDVDKDGKIEGEDLAKLRAMKKEESDEVATSDYKTDKAGRKYRAHRIVFNKGEEDGSRLREEAEIIFEAAFTSAVKKAEAAYERGDMTRAKYHLDNAKTARYALKSTEISKHKEHLDKYNELRNKINDSK